ncbi:transcriptional regulator with XRE-family HTH domain [Crossiella equi]|uniref:Transcriptional regulator with XRE-family HTH domain n=1 Tax=Crossiella equi TaxID=130796 RepID=A0ABS5AFB1_9PSEU|nr:helix-turn-helix transcriptional regulator [Crossiella equi]MBP2475002.1 transcriptional regulator with XRE-family HTH domain [Crossiella equi]
MPTSPTVANWELGLRLREHRELTGLTAVAAAKAAKLTQPYVSGVEGGKLKITDVRLKALAKAYRLTEEHFAQLTELRAAAEARSWWQGYAGLFNDDTLRFFGYEHGAAAVRSYDGGLVPALLQTEDYARAVIRGAGPNIRMADVERVLEARLIRQQRLTGPDPLRLTAVITEGVLYQQVGGHEVLAAQLRHLAAVAEANPATVDVRLIPFTAGAFHALGGGTFQLLDFPSPQLPTLLWQETVTSTSLVDHPVRLREFDSAWGQALERALSASDSLRLIRQFAKELA